MTVMDYLQDTEHTSAFFSLERGRIISPPRESFVTFMKTLTALCQGASWVPNVLGRLLHEHLEGDPQGWQEATALSLGF